MPRVQIFLWAISAFLATFVGGMLSLERNADRMAATKGNIVSEKNEQSGGNQRVVFPIEIPSSWRIEASGKEQGGWRESGIAPGDLEDVAEEVKEIMYEHGFSEIKRIAPDEMGDARKLIQYEAKSGIKVMWMLWKAGRNKTGFSWGRE